MEKAINIGMISLGCSKNQVDAERLLAQLRHAGFVLCGNAADCDVVIINTCGFIEDAKKESIEHILESAALKQTASVKAVVVTGCLAERYQQELADEMPEIDVVLGIGSNDHLVESIHKALSGERVLSFGNKDALSLEGDRVLIEAPYTAYLKVAEGCDNRCSYCAIPLIRGGFRSRMIEDIVAEAELLAKSGVTELNVVAQDTTRYGEDIYGKLMLPELLTKLCEIPQLHWVRILYCYPQRVSRELLEVMAKEPKISTYIDVPIQHVSRRILSAMNRKGDMQWLKTLVADIRVQLPDVTLRTTLITGFPGETEAEFAELCDFIKAVRFDRLGCFPYSAEEDTPAALLPDQIDEHVKQRRAEILMGIQMDIAFEKGKTMVNKTLEVLCEGFDDEKVMWYGRSAMDAPDIDTKVYFRSQLSVSPGDYVDVCIAAFEDYDLVGERV